MKNLNDGGPAFPCSVRRSEKYMDDGGYGRTRTVTVQEGGMTLRDWFAGQVQADDRLVKCVRAMDDKALELFALHPDIEREGHITEVDFTCWDALPTEVAKVARRLEMEARAIARVRYMQADAMINERSQHEKSE